MKYFFLLNKFEKPWIVYRLSDRLEWFERGKWFEAFDQDTYGLKEVSEEEAKNEINRLTI